MRPPESRKLYLNSGEKSPEEELAVLLERLAYINNQIRPHWG
jgi:hypothetical protein